MWNLAWIKLCSDQCRINRIHFWRFPFKRNTKCFTDWFGKRFRNWWKKLWFARIDFESETCTRDICHYWNLINNSIYETHNCKMTRYLSDLFNNDWLPSTSFTYSSLFSLISLQCRQLAISAHLSVFKWPYDIDRSVDYSVGEAC